MNFMVSKIHGLISYKVVMCGTGEMGQEDGMHGSFVQPTGICSEGDTLFITDTSSHSLRIITSLPAMNTFLTMLR